MKISTTFLSVGLAAALALVGCKKADDSAAPAADKTAAKTADPAAAPAPAGNAPAPAAAAAPGAPVVEAIVPATIASDDEFITKSGTELDKLSGIFTAAGTNCDQLADALTKFVADEGPTVKGLEAYEKAHADAKKKFEDATKDKTKVFEGAAETSMKACQSNQKLGAAMAKMGG